MAQLLLMALSLAADAMAVSISVGLAHPQGGQRQALRLALWFGGAQFGMPLLGAVLGKALAGHVAAVAPWAVFCLLTYLGGRMVWNGLQPPAEREPAPLTTGRMALLALATSVDALAAGVSAAFMGLPTLLSAGVIGLVTFALSWLGAAAGRVLGKSFRRWAQAAGGTALIVIGVKFLLEQLL